MQLFILPFVFIFYILRVSTLTSSFPKPSLLLQLALIIIICHLPLFIINTSPDMNPMAENGKPADYTVVQMAPDRDAA